MSLNSLKHHTYAVRLHPPFSSGTTSISVTRANFAKPGLSEHARPVGINQSDASQWAVALHAEAGRAVGGVGGDIASAETSSNH